MRHLRRSVICLLLCGLLMGSAYAAPLTSEWFVPELNQLTEARLLPWSMQDADLTKVTTRQEVCDMLITVWANAGRDLPDLPEDSPFWDTSDPAVLQCYSMGFMKGYGDSFGPDDPLSRQQMFSIMANVLIAAGVNTTVDMGILSTCVDGWSAAEWALAPTALMLQMGIAKGDSEGYVNPEATLTREQALATLWRTWQLIPAPGPQDIFGDSEWTEPTPAPEEETPVIEDAPITDPNLCSPEETYAERYTRIFGDPNSPKYQTAAEAEAHMVTITVPVWNFNYEHVKVQTSRTFQVHEAIADTIMAIFTEIFNGPEQFPIYAIGGYSWRGDGTSEHNWGIALDINPDENYYVVHGVPTVGSHWTPGEDPYSIPEDGDVVRAFAKYGFAWGGNAWTYTQDYMHFSYFGG